MSDTLYNQPAFPSTRGLPNGASVIDRGMLLRDYFAGQALAGMIANPNLCPASMDEIIHGAGRCYDMADAMLAAREQSGDGK